MEVPKVKMAPGEEKLARYLFLDPGETYGWASFNAIGEIVGMGQFHYDGDVKTLDNLITDHIIFVGIEEYVNYGWKQQKRWSKNQTSKNIGKIETICELKGIPYKRLPSSNKETGYKMMRSHVPSNHAISHQFDAAAHGVQFLSTHDIRSGLLNIPEEDR